MIKSNQIVLFTSLVATLTLTGCNGSKKDDNKPKFAFENAVTTVNTGDTVTVMSTLGKDVTYSFQGGTPENVELNEKTGKITFNDLGNTIPERVYIASADGVNDVYTIIHFQLKVETPEIKWNNVSSYLVNGDSVSASASGESGRSYSVSYKLKDYVGGIAIDAATGRIKYSTKVSNLTRFTVVATSQNASVEKEFIAMTEGVITAAVDTRIVKYNSDETATFKLDFGTNVEGDAETTQENIGYAYDGVIFQHPEGLTYNSTTKEVTFSADLIKKFAKGENKISILTQRNPVTVSLVVCDNFISSAKEFYEAFTPDYSYAKPKFKAGSLSAYYVLANDIDMTEFLSATGEGYNGGKGWAPIGGYDDQVYDIPFTGTFNGNGHTISGFKYNHPTNVCGLFGRSTGVIKNFKLVGAFTGSTMSSWSAAVCGNNSGTIENVICDVEMPNSGHYATGAICSVNHGTITNCLSINENVKGYTTTAQQWQRAGIAVGLNETDGTISKTYAVGDSSKYSLFGWSQNTDITLEKAGILFDSVDEMKAFDFSTVLNSEAFEFRAGELPTLKVGD